MAEEVGLLSLPNNLLAKVAHKTEQFDDVEKLRQWARASTTCRRFSELQLSGCPIIKSWNSMASPYLLHILKTHVVQLEGPLRCTAK